MKPRTGPAAGMGWLLVTVVIGVLTVTGSVLAVLAPPRAGDPPLLTSSLAWQIALPSALVIATVVAWRARRRGDRAMAQWMLAAVTATAVYHAGTAAVPWLVDHGVDGIGNFPAMLAFSISVGWWCLVLALLQATAVATAETALGRPFGRRARWILVAAAAGTYLLGFLLTEPPAGERFAGLPTLLPVVIVTSPLAQAVLVVVVYGWMLSLLACPVILFVAAIRERGPRRQALVRVGVGALLPGLVVMVCGVFAAFLWTDGDTRIETAALSIGFCAALPTTLAWLEATARAATSSMAASVTASTFAIRAALWSFYVLAVVQSAVPIAEGWGGGAAWGALVATALLAGTAAAWSLLVRWCIRKANPRAALAAAASAAPSSDPSALVAERALRDALADPEASVLLARPHGSWITADGSAAHPPPLDDRVAIDAASVHLVRDSRGTVVAALVHHARFIDLRPLIAAVMPLLDRAQLEADLRDHAEQAAAERRRADQATHEARTRIERDLHDGVQGRLVSLGLELGLARADVDDPQARDILDGAVAGLQSAVQELRTLSHGNLPESLTTLGLAAALGDLVSRSPVTIALEVVDVPLPADAQAVAYFVVAEALTNAVKHARPDSVAVTVRSDGTALTVTVVDDGCGGADMRAGTGLRGLSERVHAAGGRFVVSEHVPRGTILEAVLPCGS